MILKTVTFLCKTISPIGIQLTKAGLELICDRYTDFGDT